MAGVGHTLTGMGPRTRRVVTLVALLGMLVLVVVVSVVRR